MPIDRVGYGYSAYSAGDFGTEGVTHESSALAGASSSSSVSGGISKFSGATASATSSVSNPFAVADRIVSVAISGQSTVSADAESFVLKLSNLSTYGTSGYGMANYGQGDYELGVNAASDSDLIPVRVREASAVVSATSSGDALARRVPEGSALVYGTSLNTVTSDANGTRIRTSPQLAIVTGSAASDSTRVRESDSTVSATSTPIADSVFIVSADGSLDATTTSACDPAATFVSSGALSANSSSASAGDRILDCSTVFTASESALVCDPAATFAGSATPTGTASTTAKAGYVKRSTVNVQCVLTIEANARYKYEQIAKDNETWNDVSASGGTWTEVA